MYSRYLCAQGKTNAGNRYYRGSLVGNRPELMPLDSNLNADHEYGLMWNVAITSDLDKDDPKKFKMGTPSEVSDAMDRTWQRQSADDGKRRTQTVAVGLAYSPLFQSYRDQ